MARYFDSYTSLPNSVGEGLYSVPVPHSAMLHGILGGPTLLDSVLTETPEALSGFGYSENGVTSSSQAQLSGFLLPLILNAIFS